MLSRYDGARSGTSCCRRMPASRSSPGGHSRGGDFYRRGSIEILQDALHRSDPQPMRSLQCEGQTRDSGRQARGGGISRYRALRHQSVVRVHDISGSRYRERPELLPLTRSVECDAQMQFPSRENDEGAGQERGRCSGAAVQEGREHGSLLRPLNCYP